MKARKWNYVTKKYESYELPEGAALYQSDMSAIVSCAICGKGMRYGDGYTSKTIHNRTGFGYCVCENCYKKEWEEAQNG